MLDKHSRSQFADGRLHALRESVDTQKQLVLLRFESVLPGGYFTEIEELTDLAPEFRQIPILFGGKIIAHIYIVSRYNLVGGPIGRSPKDSRLNKWAGDPDTDTWTKTCG